MLRQSLFNSKFAIALFCSGFLLSASPSFAGGIQSIDLPSVDVNADKTSDGLVGTADTSTQGTVIPEQLEARPTYRAGELLENVPGLIVTQHSGEGKANQYYLRGFNLDHGTDLSIWIDDMPVNMPTQGHGQGYADINFMIPELLSGMKYQKGPYFASFGDFAAAGTVQMDYLNKLPNDMASLSYGSFGFRREFAAMSRPVDNGNALIAVENSHLDGPWQRPDDYNKYNGVLRYSQGTDTSGWSISGMAYSGAWNATNQIPESLVDSGQLNRFGTMDPSDGGDMQRYSLNGRFIDTNNDRQIKSSLYFVSSRMNLFNNFTFYLDDPTNGDQFHQHDDRTIEGGNYSYTSFDKINGLSMENTFGTSTRWDQINLGLYNTQNRNYLSTTRTDHVDEGNGAVYFENKTQWADKFRTIAGMRGDLFYADDHAYDPNDTVNQFVGSGAGPYASPYHTNSVTEGQISPKLGMIFGPWSETEFYVNAGKGLHSNDVRSVAYPIQIDYNPSGPLTQMTTARFPLIEPAIGYEAGVRSSFIPHLQTSVAVFQLHEKSEQIFSGDTATDTPSGPSTRTGIEISNFYQPKEGLIFDIDIAYTKARFDSILYDGTTDTCCYGRYIPGSPVLVIGAGLAIDDFGKFINGYNNWYGGLQYRYYGPRPLTNDNSIQSTATSLLNLRGGYNLTKNVKVQLDVDNAFNTVAQDVAYYYMVQTSPGGTPRPDVVFHAAEPRSFRLSLIGKW